MSRLHRGLCFSFAGGHRFRFLHIAPSLLAKDRFGNLIISKQYNDAMLAEAMCKLMGFTYAPSDELYWQQGHCTESDFIYITTQTLTREVTLIHAQMNQHYVEEATEYEVSVSKGFQTLTSSMAAMQTDQAILPFRAQVEERLLIRGMVFGGFTKCLYPAQKFDSDSERRFAIFLEKDTSILKWLKPPKDVLKIYYHQDEVYPPDFVVETSEARYLCEPNVLIPHDVIEHSASFTTLVGRYRRCLRSTPTLSPC